MQGKILNVNVLSQAETPGLGTKMAEPENVLLKSVRGKNPAEINLAVKKDGGDVDALTAATISSRAYVDAVARAYEAFTQVSGVGVDIDDPTGATDAASGATETMSADAQEGGKDE
jgi:electron transport complex protein RnfG